MGTAPLAVDWVYESPDGGMTVYRRRPGCVDRELISITPAPLNCLSQEDRRSLTARRLRWYRILEQATDDAELDNMIGKLEVWWALRHSENEDGSTTI